MLWCVVAVQDKGLVVPISKSTHEDPNTSSLCVCASLSTEGRDGDVDDPMIKIKRKYATFFAIDLCTTYHTLFSFR